MAVARRGRRQWRRRGKGGSDGGGKGGSRWTRQDEGAVMAGARGGVDGRVDEGAGRRRKQWRCVGPEISLPLGVW